MKILKLQSQQNYISEFMLLSLVAFCKALEEDAKERAERREKRLALGNKMKREGNDSFRQER